MELNKYKQLKTLKYVSVSKLPAMTPLGDIEIISQQFDQLTGTAMPLKREIITIEQLQEMKVSLEEKLDSITQLLLDVSALKE